MQEFPDSFALAAEAQAVTAALIARLDEFAHLADARIACLWSERTVLLHGHACRAFIGAPRVQGPMRPWFEWALAQFCQPLFQGEPPDFAMVLDHAIWQALEVEPRERLVFHELCHVVSKEDEFGIPKTGDDGRLVLQTIPHDYEFFDAEVRRYGPDVCELDAAAVALAAGYRDAERRKRHAA